LFRTILVSGIDDDRTAVASLEAGADFVRKPFRIPELMARIRSRLHTDA
jgi:DNA-binding response OmpR family regulator